MANNPVTCENISPNYPRYRFILDTRSRIKVMNTVCCGVKELTNLAGSRQSGTLERDLLDVARLVKGTCAFVFFSGVVREPIPCTSDGTPQPPKTPDYSQTFKALIEEKGLGTVIETEAKKNPNSGNDLVAYLWAVNQEAIKALVEKEDEKEERTCSLGVTDASVGP